MDRGGEDEVDRGEEDEVDRGEEDEGDYEGGEDDMSMGFSFCFRLSASFREILSIKMSEFRAKLILSLFLQFPFDAVKS